MLGNPKYKVGDIVTFDSYLFDENKKREIEGVVAIVDEYGTFRDNSDVSYDIYYEECNILYKHIREDYIKGKTGEYNGNIWDKL